MTHITTLTFETSPHKARAKASRAWGGVCLKTGLQRADLGSIGPLDQAHIYAASNYWELSKVVENILPLSHYWHNGGSHSLDAISGTNMPARIRWIIDHIHEDYQQRVRTQLIHLIGEARKFSSKVEFTAEHCIDILLGDI